MELKYFYLIGVSQRGSIRRTGSPETPLTIFQNKIRNDWFGLKFINMVLVTFFATFSYNR